MAISFDHKKNKSIRKTITQQNNHYPHLSDTHSYHSKKTNGLQTTETIDAHATLMALNVAVRYVSNNTYRPTVNPKITRTIESGRKQIQKSYDYVYRTV